MKTFGTYRRQGWNKRQAITFWFLPWLDPYDGILIKPEALTSCRFNKNGCATVEHQFFTSRAFLVHYATAWLCALRRRAEELAIAAGVPPQLAFKLGAIAFDATASDGGIFSDTSPQTFSHTITGSNPLLVLGYMLRDDAGSGAFASSVTWNSVALTSIWDQNNSGDVAGEWYLKAPDTGIRTVSLSWTGGGGVGRNEVGVISYTGAHQTAPLDAQNSVTGTGASASRTVTTSEDNEAVVSVCTKDGGTIDSVSHTQRWNNVRTSVNGAGQDEIRATAGAGSAHTFTFSTSNVYAVGIAAFKSAGAAAAVKPRSNLLLMKVG